MAERHFRLGLALRDEIDDDCLANDRDGRLDPPPPVEDEGNQGIREGREGEALVRISVSEMLRPVIRDERVQEIVPHRHLARSSRTSTGLHFR